MSKKDLFRVNTSLRKERLLRGWSQQDLANHLGVTIVTVNRWERGIQQPSPVFRLKLCQLFDKSEDVLGLCDLAGASSEHMPVLQTTPLGEETGREAGISLAQAKHSSPRHRLPFALRVPLLVVPCVLILASIMLLHWPFLPSSSSLPPRMPSSLQPLASGKVLYRAQWSKDRGGWTASSYWHWSDQGGGMIVTDSGTNSIMLAPYQVSTASYAIEASIQRINYSGLQGEAAGIVVGMTRKKGDVCGFGLGFPEQHEHFFINELATPTTQRQPHIAVDVFQSPIHLDEQWHTYRVEVTPDHLRFFSDNKLIGQVMNDMNIQGGQVGIYAVGVFIHIRGFAVFAL